MPPSKFWSINAEAKSQRKIAELAESAGYDPKALNILFNTKWNFDGREASWVRGVRAPPTELAYAKGAGVMRDNESLTHDELVARVISARKKLKREQVAAAFLSSLTTRRMDHRSTLGSLAHAWLLPRHAHAPAKRQKTCAVCGAAPKNDVDFNHGLFRRLMWAGNIEQGDMSYMLFDLENFTGKAAAPTDEDRAILKGMLAAIRPLPAKAGLGDLLKAITPHVAGNKGERQVLLEILGACGILKPRDFPSLHERWTPVDDMPEPKQYARLEWRSPVNCWTGEDGVNDDAVEFWFGGV